MRTHRRVPEWRASRLSKRCQSNRPGAGGESQRVTSLTLLCVLFLSGCSTVQPWERGTLAKPQMALDPYPMQSTYRAHNYNSREAGAGAGSHGGGGCGCY
jgi:hypothetical protein